MALLVDKKTNKKPNGYILQLCVNARKGVKTIYASKLILQHQRNKRSGKLST